MVFISLIIEFSLLTMILHGKELPSISLIILKYMSCPLGYYGCLVVQCKYFVIFLNYSCFFNYFFEKLFVNRGYGQVAIVTPIFYQNIIFSLNLVFSLSIPYFFNSIFGRLSEYLYLTSLAICSKLTTERVSPTSKVGILYGSLSFFVYDKI